MRTVEPPYKGHVFIEDRGKLKIVNCRSSDTATYKIEVKCSIVNDVPRTVNLTVVGKYGHSSFTKNINNTCGEGCGCLVDVGSCNCHKVTNTILA